MQQGKPKTQYPSNSKQINYQIYMLIYSIREKWKKKKKELNEKTKLFFILLGLRVTDPNLTFTTISSNQLINS